MTRTALIEPAPELANPPEIEPFWESSDGEQIEDGPGDAVY